MTVWMMGLLGLACTGTPDDSGSADADPWADLAFAPAGPDSVPDPSARGPFAVGGENPLVRVCRSLGFSPSSAWRGWFSGVFF